MPDQCSLTCFVEVIVVFLCFEVVEGKVKEPSLFKTLAKVFGPTMLMAHCCKLVCDVLTFIGPTLQQYVC